MKLIYIGPSIPTIGVQRFAVYRVLPEALENDAILRRLCVPVENLRQARAALKQIGSKEWSAFNSAVSKFFPNK